MEAEPIQVLEVRASEPSGLVMITVALGADASREIWIALTEQLDRRRRGPITSAEDALVLREQVALVERFAPLASAGMHAVAQFTHAELRACLLDLTSYAHRMNGEHFQPPELRERLRTIAKLTAVLWDVDAAGAELLTVAPN